MGNVHAVMKKKFILTQAYIFILNRIVTANNNNKDNKNNFPGKLTFDYLKKNIESTEKNY